LLAFVGSSLSLAALALAQWVYGAMSDFAAAAWLYIVEGFLEAASGAFLVVGITVSLLRYRLYDADTTISRSIVYGALTLSLLAIFAGSEKFIEILGEEYFGERLGALAGGLGAAIAAVCIAPIHHRATHWAEHRFRSGLVKLREGLPLLVGDMRETATPVALADAMLARVETGVRARHSAVVVGGAILDARHANEAAVAEWLTREAVLSDASHLNIDRSDNLFPVRVPLRADGVGLVGWLLLGPRPDGSFYGREEREALQAIADPVARALSIAIERDRREASREERDAARDAEVGRLARVVEGLQAKLDFKPSTRNAPI
jgi:hypothetical protein